MSKNVNSLLEMQTHELEKFDIYFSDYLLVPRAERVNIYYSLINRQLSLEELDRKYGEFFFGFDYKTLNGKEIENNDQILITGNTEVCIFYKEYRILFLLDISLSLYFYDYESKLLNIEKIEFYLRNLINTFISNKKPMKSKNSENIDYSPKLILSFLAVGYEEDCIVNLIS
jgi:hypothetical protein